MPNSCREWRGAKTKAGYGERRVNGRMVYVHRWVWEQAHGPIPEGMEVMHICDNPTCYLLEHLRLGTHAENLGDMAAKGRSKQGETNARAKLTAAQVAAIRDDPRSSSAVAADYPVSARTIRKIRSGDRWPQRTVSFTCPRCGQVSHHPIDRREAYCGACHDWTGLG